MNDRALGLLIFLPVPLVLFLFTRAPLGALASLCAGVALMVTHRLYARPFALGRAGRRCLWCGSAVANGPSVTIREPLGTTTWRTCGAAHAHMLTRVLGWAQAHALFLRVGILGTLAIFLLVAPLAAYGRLGPLTQANTVALFRLGIALTVLPMGLLASRAAPPSAEAIEAPFPVHIQALLGTAAVLWLFRLIGLAWLALGVWPQPNGSSRPRV